MKTKIYGMILTVLLAMVFLSSCATRVSMSYMVPAEYDMSGYRALAIAETEPYRFRPFELPSPYVKDMSATSPIIIYSGSRIGIEKQLASYVNERVFSEARDTGYFTLASSGVADTYLDHPSRLTIKGYDAYMRVWNEDLEIDEYIYAQEETVKVPSLNDPTVLVESTTLAYYVKQEVRAVFEWEIRATANDALLASDSYSSSRTRTTEIDLEGDTVQSAPSVLPLLRDIGSRFTSTIFSQVVPTTKTVSFALMKNDPKNYRSESAYEAVKDGNLVEALDIFEKEWKRRDHIPSLYNAALIMEALGDRDEGIELLEDGYKDTGNTKVRDLLESMKNRKSSTEEAQEQL